MFGHTKEILDYLKSSGDNWVIPEKSPVVITQGPQFVKLPDGTIINVVHVRGVKKVLEKNKIPDKVSIDIGNGYSVYDDPYGKVYGYFHRIVQPID